MKTLYFVQIPCAIARGQANSTSTPDRWLIIPVKADTQTKALERVTMALTALAQEGKMPRDGDDPDDWC
jgi:hypothetical protein